jgi:hypothetical protein
MERENSFATKIANNKAKTTNPITATTLAITVTKTTKLQKRDTRMLTLAVTLAITLAATAVIGAFVQPVEATSSTQSKETIRTTHNQHILSGLKILMTAQTSIQPSFRVYTIRT